MNKSSRGYKNPPAWATRFFRRYCTDHLSEAALGDFVEIHERRINEIGKRKADMLFIWNVILFCQPFAYKKRSNQNHINATDMLQNYFTIALRTMTRQKMYTGIKIGGFAIGLATCILIFLFIRNELSYGDRYSAYVYRAYNLETSTQVGKWSSFPANMAQVSKTYFPEIEKSARSIPYKWFNSGNNLFRRDDQKENTYEEGFTYADQDLLDILNIPIISGKADHALDQPYTMVISKRMADKYFRGEDPVGHVVILNEDQTKPYTIGGVMADFPPNSHIHFDFIITLKGVEFWQGEQTSWCCWNYEVYFKLRHDASVPALEKKMLTIRDKYYITHLENTGNQSVADVRKYHSFKLQPVRDIYMNESKVNDPYQHGDSLSLYFCSLVSISSISPQQNRATAHAK